MKKFYFIVLFLFFVLIKTVNAGEVGHYAALAWGPWDHISPQPGTGQAALGAVYYNSSKIFDGSGSEINFIDIDLNIPGIFGMIKYAPKLDILGANYSFAIVPAYGKTNINAYLSGSNIGGKADKTGWQDLNIIPINLTWEKSKYYFISAQYSFWAPTGNYNSANALNTGLGYWSHDFRITGSFFPTGDIETLLSASLLYEISSNKQGMNLRPGNRVVVEVGASHIFSKYFIAGLLAAGNWEVTYTTGSDSTDDGLDQVFSAGPEAVIYIVPEKLSLSLRYFAEFAAKDRAQGQFMYSGIGYEF